MSTTDSTKQNVQSVATTFTRDPSPLEMDAETFYHLGMVAVALATEYLEGIPQKPVYRPMTPSERQLLLYQQLPEHGRSPEALFDFFEQHILPHAMGNQHPRFAAWVNPAGAPIGMLADFLAAVMNPSAAGGDHAAIYVEHCVVRWLMELIDFPDRGQRRHSCRWWFGCLAVLPGSRSPLGSGSGWLEHAHRRLAGPPSTARALHLGRGA